jgi:hypothetical protein
MRQDEIMEMARQAHFDSKTWVDIFADNPTVGDVRNYLIAFAKLVAEREREACAKLVEDSWMAFSRTPNRRLDITPFPELEYVAKVIRARGQA